jgi:hypothetical protein
MDGHRSRSHQRLHPSERRKECGIVNVNGYQALAATSKEACCMSRAATEEERERWNPYTGWTPDPTLPQRITITCGRPDRSGKCRLRAELDGKPIHHDTIDPYNAYLRRIFVEATYTKAADYTPDESFDLRWLGDAVIAAAEAANKSSRRVVDPYKKFPTSVLPAVVANYVAAASAAIGCDPAFIALPLLGCLARAIGNKRVIRLKRSWTEPAIVWAAIVGKSGSHKTPALTTSTSFLNVMQASAIAAFQEAVAKYEQDQALYDRDYAAWKRSKSTEPPPWEPQEPACERFVTTDTTVEALAMLLNNQFDGVAVVRDELSGWLGGIGEYKGGGGSDLGHWLSMWSAAPLTVDRKTGAVKMIHVPRASVNIIGGIQPAVLRKAIGVEHMHDGLCARLLLAMPDPKPVEWTDAIVDPQTEAAMTNIFQRLVSMTPGADGDGNDEPFAISLTPEAKSVWVEYYNRHRSELAGLDDDLAAAWSKLEAYAARFALIFQLCSWAAGESDDQAVDETSIRAGIGLSDWFGGEARRVYALFSESAEDQYQRDLLNLVQRKGGKVTARDLMRSSRMFTTAAEAEAALNDLVTAGLGRWVPVPPTPRGGHPTRVFQCADTVDTDTTQESPEKREGYVNTDGIG